MTELAAYLYSLELKIDQGQFQEVGGLSPTGKVGISRRLRDCYGFDLVLMLTIDVVSCCFFYPCRFRRGVMK